MKEKFYYYYSQNPLVVNSVYLMLAAGVTALFGFVFWVLVAHFFTTTTVGLATTLLAVSGLIATLGLIGFDTIFVRFLPRSKRRNDQINSGLILAGIAAAILALLFALLTPIISPQLTFVLHPAALLSFVGFTVITMWNNLTNSVFIALRRTAYILGINVAFSLLKMLLPFVVHFGGPMTIFNMVGIAQTLNVALSIWFMMRRFGYKPSLKIHLDILKETRLYGSVVYASNVLNLLPDFILPLIVINKLGPAPAAYFYIAFTIANLLYTIVFSVTQALLAEASHDQVNALTHIRKGLSLAFALLTPAIVAVFFAGGYILRIFGYNYAHNALSLLRVLSAAGFTVILYSVMETYFRFTKSLRSMVSTTGIRAAVIVIFSFPMLVHYGLIGAGWAWVIGTSTSVVAGAIMLRRSQSRATKQRDARSVAHETPSA